MVQADDYSYMARAIRLAEHGLFTTAPNPRVGCVLVKQGKVVGEGWHERAGEPHAEIMALTAAGDAAKGATAYISLEPCCHHGRTPPCSDALISAGISRAVVAMEDPNPQVAGKGITQLREAGIDVDSGVMTTQSESLNPGFVQRMRQGRPFVRCKLAMSLDGRTAMASGESQWITGEPAREDVHRLRARSSAIITGIETVLADNPLMNVRLEEVKVNQPMRVVLDTHLRMPLDARMLSLPGRTIVCTTQQDKVKVDELIKAGAEVVQLPEDNGRVSIDALMDYLVEEQVNEVMIEAGATLNGALLQAGRVDEIVIYMAPLLMGDDARSLFALPGLSQMKDRVSLTISDVRAIGKDWRITARPQMS